MRARLTGQVSILTTALATVLFYAMSPPVTAASDCENLKGCERKFCEIESQLTTALEKGNERKASGLRKSLENAKNHCTDKGLEKDLIEEIKEANEEIAEYESDLAEAKEDGSADKIRKYKEKIEEENSKIKSLESELSDLY